MMVFAWKLLLLLPLYPYVGSAGSAWSPLGSPICSKDNGTGQSLAIAEGNVGSSSSSSASKIYLAVGFPLYTKTMVHQGAAQVYVYDNEQCTFVEDGTLLIGEETEDQLGKTTSMSCDGSIVAVGGDTSTSGVRTGLIQVYKRSSSTSNGSWEQMGTTLRPENVGANFGHQLELSCDGLTLGVAAYGYSQVFRYNGNDWIQHGNKINRDKLVLMSLSADGNRIAVGEKKDDSSSQAKPVQVYQFASASWEPVGAGILPIHPGRGTNTGGDEQFYVDSFNEQLDIPFPTDIVLADDGKRVTINGRGWSNSGQHQFGIFVFDEDSNGNWVQAGKDFSGQGYGGTMAMSGNGEFVYDMYHDEYSVPNSGTRTWVQQQQTSGGEWTMGTHTALPFEPGWDGIMEIGASSSGSLLVVGIARKSDKFSGAVQVLFYPDSDIVEGCLPSGQESDECREIFNPNQQQSEDSNELGELKEIIEELTNNFTVKVDGVDTLLQNTDESKSNNGLAVAGIFLGIMGLLALVILIVILIIYLPRQKPASSQQAESRRLEVSDDASSTEAEKSLQVDAEAKTVGSLLPESPKPKHSRRKKRHSNKKDDPHSSEEEEQGVETSDYPVDLAV